MNGFFNISIILRGFFYVVRLKGLLVFCIQRNRLGKATCYGRVHLCYGDPVNENLLDLKAVRHPYGGVDSIAGHTA